MNSLYFAAPAEKKYVDAGYRWAYWMLEHPGIVRLNERVDIDAVLACDAFWHFQGEEKHDRVLRDEVLPRLRSFLGKRRTQEVIFVDENFFDQQWELGHDWKEIQTA